LAFRIDVVAQVNIQGAPFWQISFKGVNGVGDYATYYGAIDGKGLFTCELLAGGFTLVPVANSERVHITAEMPKEKVITLIATWMKLQGWGTEVNQLRQPIMRDMARLVDPGDGSGELLLAFSPELIQLQGWEEGMEFNVEVVEGALAIEPRSP
jgi:hypothetical protein